MLPISITVNADGINLDVRVKSVAVEQDSTSSKVGTIEMVREALVLKVHIRLLQRNLRTICLQ